MIYLFDLICQIFIELFTSLLNSSFVSYCFLFLFVGFEVEAKYLAAQGHGSFGHVWAAPMQPGMPGMPQGLPPGVPGMQSQGVYQARTRLEHEE